MKGTGRPIHGNLDRQAKARADIHPTRADDCFPPIWIGHRLKGLGESRGGTPDVSISRTCTPSIATIA